MPVSTLLMSSLASGVGGNTQGQGLANIGAGLISGVTGFFQRRAAKKALAKLQRPEYQIPDEILRNQKMAEQAANEGLPSAQYNQAMQNIQRQQNRGISAAADRRGGLMALPGLQQQANDALLGLDVKNAQARMANQQKLYGINSQVAGYKDKQWDINKMQPYERDYQYNMGLLGAGNQNLVSGGEKLLGGAGELIASPKYRSKQMTTTSNTQTPQYYGGYGAGSDYSGFETGY
jgi:hypothetical protein